MDKRETKKEKIKCEICDRLFSKKWLYRHIASVHNVLIKDYLIKYRYNNIYPICKCGCGQNVNFRKNLFSDYVNGHYQSNMNIELRNVIRSKIRETMMKKYGVEHNWSSNELRDKTKQKNIDKYGVKYLQLISAVKDKIKQTKKKRYGNENYNNLEKYKNTMIEKYGVDSPLKNKSIREKVKQTCLNKYGVENPSQSEEIKERIKQNNLKKYDVEHIFQRNDIKEKSKKTKYKKYNDCYYTNSEKSKKTKLIRYGCEYYNNRKKANNTNLKIYGIKHNWQRGILRGELDKKNRIKFFQSFLTNRFSNIIIPLFTADDYKGVYNKYKFQCKKCNCVFYDNIIGGKIPRCLKCNPINYQQSQNDILEYIKSIYKEEVLNNTRNIIPPQELDIYIPDKKIAIEFNGLYWHSEISGGKDKNYHLNKTLECEKHGIQLIHIFEDEWVNKEDIVKNRLKHILNLSSEKVYARKCGIRKLFNDEKNIFLTQYHIQGTDNSGIRLGLFYDGELVAVMTFGKRRVALGKKQTDENEYELLRYATSVNVVGGADKLLKYFIRNYNPKEIITYADRRWSQGNLYEKLVFEKQGETPVNYWYFKNGHIERIHRFNFRKNVLNKKLENFDDKLTEWQNMQLNGYDRIWDCGNLKYEKII